MPNITTNSHDDWRKYTYQKRKLTNPKKDIGFDLDASEDILHKWDTNYPIIEDVRGDNGPLRYAGENTFPTKDGQIIL